MAALASWPTKRLIKTKEPGDNIKATGFNASGLNQTGGSLKFPSVEILDFNMYAHGAQIQAQFLP